MTTETSQRRTIGAFLITGTLLALYLTIEVGYAIYWEQFTTLMLRGGVMSKIALIVILHPRNCLRRHKNLRSQKIFLKPITYQKICIMTVITPNI